MEVKANRVPDDAYSGMSNPGDYIFHPVNDPKPAFLHFLCPCGCGKFAGISLKPVHPHGWDWNGDKDKPTATPSILIDRDHWHGYLTDGVFKSC